MRTYAHTYIYTQIYTYVIYIYLYLACRIYFKSYLRTYDIITFELKSVNFITNNNNQARQVFTPKSTLKP